MEGRGRNSVDWRRIRRLKSHGPAGGEKLSRAAEERIQLKVDNLHAQNLLTICRGGESHLTLDLHASKSVHVDEALLHSVPDQVTTDLVTDGLLIRRWSVDKAPQHKFADVEPTAGNQPVMPVSSTDTIHT